MQKLVMASLAVLALTLLPFRGDQAKGQERPYEEMRAEVVELYGEGRFAEAAAVLSDALELYPDHLMANCFNLALMFLRLEQHEESLKSLAYGLDRDIWYGDYTFLDAIWEPLKQDEGWAAFQARNEEAKALEQRMVEPRLEVVLPRGYEPARRYPLFLALHGGGENVDAFMPNWVSPVLQDEFIVAFPQSTQLIAMDGYNWTEDIDLSLREIRAAFDQVVGRYSVDTDRVLVGGFSSGGVAALEVVLKDVLPVRGFVVLCPAMPDDFSPEAVRGARERGVRGTLLTTEMDGRVDQQTRMAEIMEAEALSHEFHITPNIGHWYPTDLAERIDRAIAHIRKGS
ncbi:alpha/beta fold hydrolase [Gemmatimonadota bacterium]